MSQVLPPSSKTRALPSLKKTECLACKSMKHSAPSMTKRQKRRLWKVAGMSLMDPTGARVYREIQKLIPPAPVRSMGESVSIVSLAMNPPEGILETAAKRPPEWAMTTYLPGEKTD